MNSPIKLQVIKSLQGNPEYVLIPIAVYNALRTEIEDEIAGLDAVREERGEYLSFRVEDYVGNPIAAARIKAGITQEELARRMKVSQPYVAKLEGQERATAKVLQKVTAALANAPRKSSEMRRRRRSGRKK